MSNLNLDNFMVLSNQPVNPSHSRAFDSVEEEIALEARRAAQEAEIKAKAMVMAEQVQHDWACGKDRSGNASADMSVGFDDEFMKAFAGCIYMLEHPTKEDYCHKVALQKLVLAHRKGMAELFEPKIAEDYDDE